MLSLSVAFLCHFRINLWNAFFGIDFFPSLRKDNNDLFIRNFWLMFNNIFYDPSD